MSRTATILVKTHEGNWELLANPDANIVETLRTFRNHLGVKVHDTYEKMVLQESDGPSRKLHFRTPEANEAHDKLRESEAAAHAESLKKPDEKPKAENKPVKPKAEKPDK